MYKYIHNRSRSCLFHLTTSRFKHISPCKFSSSRMTFTTRDRNNSEQTQFRARISRPFRFASMDRLEKPFVPHLLAVGQCPDGTSCNKVSEKLSRPEAMKQNWRRSWDEVTAEETSLTNSNLIPRAGAPRLMHEARRAPLFSSCRVLVPKPGPSFPCGTRRTLILALCKSNSSLENSNFFPLSPRSVADPTGV